MAVTRKRGTRIRPKRGILQGFDREREAKKRWPKQRQQQELALFAWCCRKQEQ